MTEDFLSDGAISLHKEHLLELRRLYSVYKKSYEGLENYSIAQISRLHIPRAEKIKIQRLKGDIMAHELYFSSFGNRYTDSRAVRHSYGSIPSFYYRVKQDAMGRGAGFLFVFAKDGEVWHSFSCEPHEAFESGAPILAIDLFEHAYFTDYGFSREEYIDMALSYLDLSKCDG